MVRLVQAEHELDKFNEGGGILALKERKLPVWPMSEEGVCQGQRLGCTYALGAGKHGLGRTEGREGTISLVEPMLCPVAGRSYISFSPHASAGTLG